MTQSAQKLQEFRSKAYQILGRAKDASFDLMDGVLVPRNIYSFAELSLSPGVRSKTVGDSPRRSLRRPGDKSYGTTWSFEPKSGSIPEKTEKMGQKNGQF